MNQANVPSLWSHMCKSNLLIISVFLKYVRMFDSNNKYFILVANYSKIKTK